MTLQEEHQDGSFRNCKKNVTLREGLVTVGFTERLCRFRRDLIDASSFECFVYSKVHFCELR